MCFHCGIICKHSGIVVHKDTCNIGSDERLNQALFMLQYCFDTAVANDGIGRNVAADILEFMSSYK